MTTATKTRRPLQVSKPSTCTAESDFKRKQACQILEQIVVLVCIADRVGYWNGVGNSAQQAEDTILTLRTLIDQIGLLADIGVDKLDGSVAKGTDAEDWLMPPIYPQNREFEGDAS